MDKLMNTLRHRAYIAGYEGWIPPRLLRRAMARSRPHRAWLAGRLGYFEESGVSYGPANPYGRKSEDADMPELDEAFFANAILTTPGENLVEKIAEHRARPSSPGDRKGA